MRYEGALSPFQVTVSSSTLPSVALGGPPIGGAGDLDPEADAHPVGMGLPNLVEEGTRPCDDRCRPQLPVDLVAASGSEPGACFDLYPTTVSSSSV